MLIVGVSLATTPHQLRRGGQDFFLCCGVDLLLNAVNGPVSGRTQCPVCAREIRVTLDRTTIELLEPTGAIVSVHESSNAEGETCVVCSDSALFDSRECIDLWRVNHPSSPVSMYTVGDYLDRCCGPRFHTPLDTPPPRQGAPAKERAVSSKRTRLTP
jgi:hypothetical protein